MIFLGKLLFFFLNMGKDKVAEVIQWGRDHGLPTYTQVRQYLYIQKKSSKKSSKIYKLSLI